jgi:hypothetical protein
MIVPLKFQYHAIMLVDDFPFLFYFQPKWCKHIYASFWDMQRRFNLSDVTSFRLPQPNDEPMNEYYREKFEIDYRIAVL